MPSAASILEDLSRAVFAGQPEEVLRIFRTGETEAFEAPSLLSALTSGLHEARKKLAAAAATVAEFLLSVDALHAGVGCLKPRLSEPQNKPRVVIGVVQGDVHELGAEIIAGVMDAMGYSVLRLGTGKGPDQFIEALNSSRAKLLGLSSMMTTTLPAMRETIERCRRACPDVRIMVGGAALDSSIAQTMGADGYAASVVELPDELERLEALAGSGEEERKYTDYERKIQVIEKGSRHGA
ncbi:MAG: cobalamin B12-binding domain-containing protein [Desulfobacterales bacterium]|nr:cobalamin B12-binding domain-containing protein [Desulfobacterales bacterium]